MEQTLQLCPLNVLTNVQSGIDHSLHKPLLEIANINKHEKCQFIGLEISELL